MIIETAYFKDADKKREEYLSRVIVDQEHKDEIMKNLYPKYIACIEADNTSEVEFNLEFKGETEMEARGKAVAWLYKLRDEISEIIEKEGKNTAQTP